MSDERSYTSFGSAWREADDQNKRININAYHLYTPESNYLSFGKLDFDYQKQIWQQSTIKDCAIG